MIATFGKMMENVRTHWNVKLLTSLNIAKKRIPKPNLEGYKRFYDCLLAVIFSIIILWKDHM